MPKSQSLNLWIQNPDISKLSSMHFYSWKKGLKTGIYCPRRRAVTMAQTFSIEVQNQIYWRRMFNKYLKFK